MLKDDFDRLRNKFEFDECIHGKEEYFNSVVLVLLILIDNEYHFVFQKRSKNIRQGGEICFPGGKIDKRDKTLQDVAIRETKEELGIPENKIQIIGRLDTIVAPMGVTVDAFIGITEIRCNDLIINHDEVDKIITIPIDYFIKNEPEKYSVQIKMHPSYIDNKTNEEVILLPSEKLGLPDVYKGPWGNFKYGVYVYKTEDEVIWGITARLILDFICKIQ